MSNPQILISALALCVLAPVPAAALSTSSMPRTLLRFDNNSVATKLVVSVGPEGYPDPICSQCRVRTTKNAASSTAEDTATLSISRDSVNGLGFAGDVEVVVELADGERRVVLLESLNLQAFETREYTIASDPDWRWDEIDRVWVELSVG